MSENTPFSFHCMICFEEFHPEERYPVVLPCGHTYICHLCANRLEKCMECRTPLYELIQPPKHASVQPSPHGSPIASRWGSGPSNRRVGSPDAPPPQRPMKRRLALPKNVVLLSLIEATELASAAARKKYFDSPEKSGHDEANEFSPDQEAKKSATRFTASGGSSIPALHSMGSMLDVEEDDEEDEEEEKIKISTTLALGVAGTYAVAAREGLEIFPERPSPVGKIVDSEDVESMVKVYHLDRKATLDEEEDDNTSSPRAREDPLRLCYGDRVQVVTIDGGWAKLARGYGYVRAERNTLVKVGNSVDNACKLEAILCHLSNRRKELRIEQNKIDNQFIQFMNGLQHALQNDEDLTVIPADTFAASPLSTSFTEAPKWEKEEKTASPEDSHYPQKPPRVATPPPPETPGSRFACFAGGMFGDTSNNSRDDADLIRSALTSPEWAGSGYGGSNDGDDSGITFLTACTHPSHSAMRAGAQAWREQHGRRPVRDNIDFRTGMSGHMALLSTHAHPHQYLEPTNHSRSMVARMSSHSGLTVSKGISFQGIFNSLTLPVIGTPPRPENSAADTEVRPTGSL